MLKKRLIKGIGAHALGQIITLIIQLASIPLFIHFWGKNLYGEWLSLTAIPTYLTMTDLGFANAAATEMTMRIARGDKEGALEVFQSVSVVVISISLFAALVMVALAQTLPIHHWFNLHILSENDVRVLLPILVFQIFFGIQRGVIETGYKSDGNFAIGVVVYHCARLFAFCVMSLTVILGGRTREAAFAYLFAEIMANIFVMRDVRRRSPWLHHGFDRFNVQTAKRLISPALSFAGFTMASALSIQGMIIVIGIVLGPASVVVYSTLRTLTRITSQILIAITNSVFFELSAAFGRNDFALARRLHARACQVSLWIALCICGAMALCGKFLYQRWTGGKVEFDSVLFYLLLVVVVCNSVWSASYTVSAAANKHQKVSTIYTLASAASLAVGAILMREIGIHGAALALLIVDIVMIFFVVPISLSLIGDNQQIFWRSVMSPPIELILRTFQTKQKAVSG